MRGLTVLRGVVFDPHALFDVRSKIFHDHVGVFNQPHEDFVPGPLFQIERQRTFVAMEIEHVGAIPRTAHAFVRVDARRRFDLDDVGTKIAEDAATGRPGAHAREIKHAELCQRGRRLRSSHNSGP